MRSPKKRRTPQQQWSGAVRTVGCSHQNEAPVERSEEWLASACATPSEALDFGPGATKPYLHSTPGNIHLPHECVATLPLVLPMVGEEGALGLIFPPLS